MSLLFAIACCSFFSSVLPTPVIGEPCIVDVPASQFENADGSNAGGFPFFASSTRNVPGVCKTVEDCHREGGVEFNTNAKTICATGACCYSQLPCADTGNGKVGLCMPTKMCAGETESGRCPGTGTRCCLANTYSTPMPVPAPSPAPTPMPNANSLPNTGLQTPMPSPIVNNPQPNTNSNNNISNDDDECDSIDSCGICNGDGSTCMDKEPESPLWLIPLLVAIVVICCCCICLIAFAAYRFSNKGGSPRQSHSSQQHAPSAAIALQPDPTSVEEKFQVGTYGGSAAAIDSNVGAYAGASGMADPGVYGAFPNTSAGSTYSAPGVDVFGEDKQAY